MPNSAMPLFRGRCPVAPEPPAVVSDGRLWEFRDLRLGLCWAFLPVNWRKWSCEFSSIHNGQSKQAHRMRKRNAAGFLDVNPAEQLGGGRVRNAEMHSFPRTFHIENRRGMEIPKPGVDMTNHNNLDFITLRKWTEQIYSVRFGSKRRCGPSCAAHWQM